MDAKSGMKLAAAAIGTSITGKPLYQVSRKVLPIRANWPAAEGLIFAPRLVSDGAGRQIEELVLISGRFPPGAPRFFFRGLVKIKNIGNGREGLMAIPNEHIKEPWPIVAKNLKEAFAAYDTVLQIQAEKIEHELQAAEEAEKKAKAEAPTNPTHEKAAAVEKEVPKNIG